jgi:hypothetical protein
VRRCLLIDGDHIAGNIRQQSLGFRVADDAVAYISSRSEEFLQASHIDLLHVGDGAVKLLTAFAPPADSLPACETSIDGSPPLTTKETDQ